MVRNYTRLQELIANRRTQTVSEWNDLIRKVIDDVDAEARYETNLPGNDTQLNFEQYQEWVRKLGEIKGWNISGWPQIEAQRIQRELERVQRKESQR